MFVNRILGRIPLSDGRFVDQVESPDWNTIERAIRALDRHVLTVELYHFAPDEVGHTSTKTSFMGITRGFNSHYLVFVCDVNGVVNILTKDSKSDPASSGRVLNEEDSAEPPVTLDEVIPAARTYAVSGELDGGVSWEKMPLRTDGTLA